MNSAGRGLASCASCSTETVHVQNQYMPTYLLPNAAPNGGFATTFPHFDNIGPYRPIYIAMIFDNTWSFMITGSSEM